MTDTPEGTEPSDVTDKGHSPMGGLSRLIHPSSPAVMLDEIDRMLVTLLAEDPRASHRKLAQRLNVSGPTVGDRIARLERLGVIRGYTVSVDWATLGLPVEVYIPIIIAPGADLERIVTDLKRIPELASLDVVTGVYDLMTRFRLRDHLHLQRLLLERIWPIDGLQRIETFLSLGAVDTGSLLERMMSPDTDLT
ncbi:Lrp/AsnC family transcriptional regulator [Demequina capsici]|uniref:Lrp/AsnC family transcriptional regulator n=1 Tax=Demequina capsici TaxID=3075620 RepID=A0AA96J9J2_9MICO|nr:Lrp/AsnC family transcriptional regulator [Demequina sp. PMTSA13]WNM27327.1 Lrp/AsnC family transcriptional regulator [Demequina sp. PMTSA13]